MNEDATKRPLETLSDKRVPEPWQLKFRTVIIIISMTKLPRACFKSLKENYNQWPLQCAQRLHFWQTKSSKERNPFIFSILTGQTMSRNEKKVLGLLEQNTSATRRSLDEAEISIKIKKGIENTGIKSYNKLSEFTSGRKPNTYTSYTEYSSTPDFQICDAMRINVSGSNQLIKRDESDFQFVMRCGHR